MIREEELKRIKDELYTLYQKALTEEDYKKIVALADKCSVTLRVSRESPDTIAEKILDGLWGEYYLRRKFPEAVQERAAEDNSNFIEKIESLINQVVEPVNKAELLYLSSVAWSHLLGDYVNAEWCNSDLQKLISSGKVPTSLVFKGINSRVIKEMGFKDYKAAIIAADEINKFPEDIITRLDNIGTSANIYNNRGASYNRGKIDPVKGAIDLLQAAIYYSFQNEPATKHFKGLPDRLRESIDNMASKEFVMGSPNEEILPLIEEAKNILQPVSEEIKKGQVSGEYFKMLATNLSDIREKILKLFNKQA